MDWLTLIDSRLAAAVIPVLIGAGLLGWWAHVRDRRITRREQAIKFIEETGDRLNAAISRAFVTVRKQSLLNLREFNDRVADLDDCRLGTRIKSKALLGSGDFARDYERVMYQLGKLRKVLESWKTSEDADAAVEGVRRAIPEVDHEDLEVWGNATGPEALPRPWGYFETWLDWLWSMSDELLAKALESALKGKRRFRYAANPSLQRTSAEPGRRR